MQIDVSANVSLRYLNTTSTPLTCIQVNQDQLANIPAGWEKEATASYAVDCQAASGIEDELLAASIRMYPNPVNDVLTVEIMRDSTGSNDGSLLAIIPTVGTWATAPTASVQIYRAI